MKESQGLMNIVFGIGGDRSIGRDGTCLREARTLPAGIWSRSNREAVICLDPDDDTSTGEGGTSVYT